MSVEHEESDSSKLEESDASKAEEKVEKKRERILTGRELVDELISQSSEVNSVQGVISYAVTLLYSDPQFLELDRDIRVSQINKAFRKGIYRLLTEIVGLLEDSDDIQAPILEERALSLLRDLEYFREG